MRHRRRSKRFNRTASHLKAMLRNMAASLFRHDRIVTTPQKAKECRRFAEKMITMGKKGGLANFRRALAHLGDKEMTRKLFTEIAPRYASRQGGYTRILHLADVRVGDAARQCIFELVEADSAAHKSGGRKRPGKSAHKQASGKAPRDSGAGEDKK